MNGMEMMVNTLLKACGFSKEQLDNGVKVAQAKAVEYEARFVALETNIAKLVADNAAILALLRKGNDNASDAVADDVAGD